MGKINAMLIKCGQAPEMIALTPTKRGYRKALRGPAELRDRGMRGPLMTIERTDSQPHANRQLFELGSPSILFGDFIVVAHDEYGKLRDLTAKEIIEVHEALESPINLIELIRKPCTLAFM